MAVDAYASLSHDNVATHVIMAEDLETAKSFLGENVVKVVNWAEVGWIYDPEKDRFVAPLPPELDGYIWNEETDRWNPPFMPPLDGKEYVWDGSIKNWVENTPL